MTDQLIPRQPRKMLQPHKEELRKQLALAADRIQELTAQLEQARKPFWLRLRNK